MAHLSEIRDGEEAVVPPPATDAGLVFIVTAALLFTPILHRVMHRIHLSEKL